MTSAAIIAYCQVADAMSCPQNMDRKAPITRAARWMYTFAIAQPTLATSPKAIPVTVSLTTVVCLYTAIVARPRHRCCWRTAGGR